MYRFYDSNRMNLCESGRGDCPKTFYIWICTNKLLTPNP